MLLQFCISSNKVESTDKLFELPLAFVPLQSDMKTELNIEEVSM